MITVSQEKSVLLEQLLCGYFLGANKHCASSFQWTVDSLEVNTNMVDAGSVLGLDEPRDFERFRLCVASTHGPSPRLADTYHSNRQIETDA